MNAEVTHGENVKKKAPQGKKNFLVGGLEATIHTENRRHARPSQEGGMLCSTRTPDLYLMAIKRLGLHI